MEFSKNKSFNGVSAHTFLNRVNLILNCILEEYRYRKIIDNSIYLSTYLIDLNQADLNVICNNYNSCFHSAQWALPMTVSFACPLGY